MNLLGIMVAKLFDRAFNDIGSTLRTPIFRNNYP
jgi:hypothetical protein